MQPIEVAGKDELGGLHDGAFVIGRALREVGIGCLLAALAPPVTVKAVARAIVDQRVKHHVLMIALEEMPVRVEGLPFDERVENLLDGGTAIDIIAEKNDGIFPRIHARAGDQLIHQGGQFDVVTVDIPDREESVHEFLPEADDWATGARSSDEPW